MWMLKPCHSCALSPKQPQAPDTLPKGAFLASSHRKISVALCKGNYGIFHSGVQHYTRASGHARLEGLQVPSDEVE